MKTRHALADFLEDLKNIETGEEYALQIISLFQAAADDARVSMSYLLRALMREKDQRINKGLDL